MKSGIRIGANAALVIIDVQKGFDDPQWGRRNNADAEEKIAALLAEWRLRNRPVFHVKHNSKNAGSPLHPANAGNAIKDAVAPLAGEPLIEKDVNSAFIGTNLEARLQDAGVRELVVVGLTTSHCVSTTARMAGNLGFTTYVVSDAVAAFEWQAHDGRTISPEDMHYHALAALHREFAHVVSCAAVFDALQPMS
jgi:nicotinamidase-related amidase